MDKNIVLLGFMGTGKTSVSKRLADELGMQFIEMDGIIEKNEGISISEIFEKKGEVYFRSLERDLVKELSKEKGQVISAGGGVVLNPDNIKDLKKSSILICLNATPEEIYKRIKNETHRPLLKNDKPLERIKKILNDRKKYYEKISLQIDTTDKDIDKIVDEIKRIINDNNKS